MKTITEDINRGKFFISDFDLSFRKNQEGQKLKQHQKCR